MKKTNFNLKGLKLKQLVQGFQNNQRKTPSNLKKKFQLNQKGLDKRKRHKVQMKFMRNSNMMNMSKNPEMM